MQKILKTYLRRLTNLTSRNRSLLLLKLPQEQFFDLHQLDFLDNKTSFDYINQLIAEKKQIILCDVQDSRLEKVNEASKSLRKLARTEIFIEQERGAKDLYVGYPFVKGKLSDGTIIRCPLLFFPVTLLNNGKKWILEKRDEGISLNRSFLLAYAHFNQIRISDELLETSFDDFSKESLVFRTELYEFLKNTPLAINFNQDTFQDKLIDFQGITKTNLEENEHNGELKLFPQAVLGIFPQAGSYLVPDYEQLIDTENSTSYQGEFFAHSLIEKSIREESTFLPFAVDASQENAIRAIKSGQSVVIQGPPGTGKSQLIANLVADFTARGKRVLVVCQKRVALDTVFNRLKKANLSNFIALIHDFKNDRKALFEKIANQIESIDTYRQQNKSLDAIFLERKFTQNSRRIDQISVELDSFKQALYDENICGISVKEMYLTSNLQDPKIDLTAIYQSFRFNEILDFETRLKHYFEYENKLNTTEKYRFWQERISFKNFTFSDAKKIIESLDDFRNFQAKNTTKFNFKELVSFDENIVKSFYQLFENKAVIDIFKIIISEQKYIKNNHFNLSTILQTIENLFLNGWLENTIEIDALEIKKIQIQKAISASKSGFSSFIWKQFSKDKTAVNEMLVKNKLSFQTTDLELIIKKIENRILFEELKNQLATAAIFINEKDNFENIKQTLKNYIIANEAYSIYQTHLFLQKEKFDLNFYKNLEELIIEAKQNSSEWKKYLSNNQLEILDKENNHENDELNKDFLRKNFDLMYEADKLKNDFSSIELLVVEKLEKIAEDPIKTFQNSLRLQWIEHIENLYPILRSVSSLKMQQMEEELQICVQEKQALSNEIILLKLREQTYKDLIFNRLQNIISYRELLHQTTKKRKVWSVRKLIENYADEIFKLIPCWLASPESVSAIFALPNDLSQKQFDLVIFDEASQCFAEYGIPAIFRGKQVLIAGDSKQLQPSDLYQVRYEENLEEGVSYEPILEIDSLLDLANQYLPQFFLTGHYRSQSLDLINFSNQYFYKNSLHLLPHYQQLIKKEPSIDYIKVEGVWEKNTNEIEAEKTVELIRRLQTISPQKSIGIVTFNHKQADLINYKLENFISNAKQISVKNIENIQGDEFDIVVFSIAYAPDEKGKMLMNFGSLNQAGGENRLNVAITRAREKIYIISSIFPQQLEIENTQNIGPKLLKKYLEYALLVSERKYFYEPILPSSFRTSWFLKEKLKKDNPLLTNELPFADLTIQSEKKQYEALLLTDDDLYFSALSPKENHAYLPIHLREKGWQFERLWSRNEWIKSE